jgi:putative nucleotidyltransferase with HDIG domain
MNFAIPATTTQFGVLLVEDNPGDARLVELLLGEQKDVAIDLAFAVTLHQAVERVTERNFDAILLDLSLPDSMGLGTLGKMMEAAGAVPIIVLTGLQSEEVAFDAMRSGAADYLVKGRDDGRMIARAVRYAVARREAEERRLEAVAAVRQALSQTVQAIALTVEKRDPYTAGHQQRVAHFATAVAEELGLPANDIEGLYFAGTLHDIGKISLPQEILTRPGRLMPLEYELIKTHSAIGYDIVKEISFPWPVAQMIRQHHERMDGSGYPDGLSGDDILFCSRILAVADVVESMNAHRPYRPALGLKAALDEVIQHRGSRYDADVVDAAVRLLESRRYVFE